MSTPFRKSTATQVMQFTMVDSTTALPKTGLSIANTDIKLIFEGGTTQTSKNSGGATEIGSTGTYYCTFDATDTATIGRLHIDIQKTGALPYFKDTEVLPALVWDALYASSGGAIMADLQTIKTQAVTCSAGVTVGAFVGNATAALAVNASGRVDVGLWLGGTIPAVNVTGVPLVDVKYLLGTAWLTPGTAGTPDVNVKLINAVSTTSVTTINANQGTTQPVNFTSTGASALAKVDMIDIASVLVNNASAQLGVNVVQAGAVNWASGAIVSGAFASGAITSSAFAAGAITATVIADAAIDSATFAGDTGMSAIRANTATGGSSTSITLDASASSFDNFYNDYFIQSRTTGEIQLIIAYDGTSKVATTTTWQGTAPTNGTLFVVMPRKATADVYYWLGSLAPAAPPTTSAIASAIWRDTTAADFTTALSVGKSIMNGVSLGTGLTIARCTLTDTLTTYTGNTVQTGDAYAVANGRLPAALSSGGFMKSDLQTWLTVAPLALSSQKVQATATVAGSYLATGTVASTTGTTTTLDSGSVATTSYYVGDLLVITAGTGAGQDAVITAYTSGRIATHAAWTTNPDATSTYEIRTGKSSATITGGGDASEASVQKVLAVVVAQGNEP